MKIIYISGLYPTQILKNIEANSKSFIHYGPNKLQHEFVKGLKEVFSNVTVITSPLVGTFPKSYKNIFFKSFTFLENETRYYSVASIRLPIFDLISKTVSLFICLNNVVKSSKINNYIVVYSPHFPYLVASFLCKLFNNNVKVCVYINDLPEYMSSNKNLIYLFLKQIEKLLFGLLIKYFDSFILVTELLSQKLNLNSKPWVCIEGVFSEVFFGDSISRFRYLKEINDKVVLYSGSLDSRYGINDLINAFSLINDSNIKLWICGYGEMGPEIINIARSNKNIIFLGQISHEDVLQLQKVSNILINPRKPFDDFTKYSFPIKTLEYLASGVPTIMYQLPGISSDYYKYFYSPKGYELQDLVDIILDILNTPEKELLEKSLEARQFILSNNNVSSQFSKLFQIIN
jgi:glycosyltransferase involved in cell wall biosynthesis